LNVIGKEIQQLKPTTELQSIVSKDGNSIKGNVIYIDHFGNVVVNISQKQFMEVGKGRMFEIDIKPKPIKSIQSNYSAVAVSDKFPIKYFEGEQLALFNEVGFLEIALFRSNPSTVGSAQTLLGIGYRDTITINFK
jgi:S-adenosylmethionine hydrolase